MNYKAFIFRDISYGKDKLSVLALILECEDSFVMLPIVINSGEVQAVSYSMENDTKSTIPLIQDVFSRLIKNVGYHVDSVEIREIVKGVLLSNIILKNEEGNTITLDTKTSDAVAMALRFSAPIHVSESVISEVGIAFPFRNHEQDMTKIVPVKEETYSIEDLQDLLDMAVKKEYFDVAIELDKELRKRKKEI